MFVNVVCGVGGGMLLAHSPSCETLLLSKSKLPNGHAGSQPVLTFFSAAIFLLCAMLCCALPNCHRSKRFMTCACLSVLSTFSCETTGTAR